MEVALRHLQILAGRYDRFAHISTAFGICRTAFTIPHLSL
jgi:hypothetical protein